MNNGVRIFNLNVTSELRRKRKKKLVSWKFNCPQFKRLLDIIYHKFPKTMKDITSVGQIIQIYDQYNILEHKPTLQMNKFKFLQN